MIKRLPESFQVAFLLFSWIRIRMGYGGEPQAIHAARLAILNFDSYMVKTEVRVVLL
jgi:hypothetical protein